MSIPRIAAAPKGREAELEAVRSRARGCTACSLYKTGTQTVFGEGPADAAAVFVGEQPGDREDLSGRPFVGPAGALLDKALAEAGIDRSRVYVTNAVKHFKWEPRGKKRIHKKPNASEISACRQWLDAELELLSPEIVVCLGATAAQALLGRDYRVSVSHGRLEERGGRRFMATVHPSSILRAPDESARRAAYAQFVADLRAAAPLLARGARRAARRPPPGRNARSRGSRPPTRSPRRARTPP